MRILPYQLSFALLASLAMAGCGSSPSNSPCSTSTATTMRGVSTVAFHPRARIVHPAPGRSTLELQGATDRALIQILDEAGYSIGDVDRSDIILAYAVGISGEMHDEETMKIFGISPGLDLALPETRGAIVLALVDPVTGQVLWRACASGAASNDGASSKELQARIERAVRAILNRIPRR